VTDHWFLIRVEDNDAQTAMAVAAVDDRSRVTEVPEEIAEVVLAELAQLAAAAKAIAALPGVDVLRLIEFPNLGEGYSQLHADTFVIRDGCDGTCNDDPSLARESQSTRDEYRADAATRLVTNPDKFEYDGGVG
jgi:hypothetical protein